MSIGNALAEGRRQAGLTITEVSQRTCIRETIIRGIESGDFSSCGGDFYARGHIRSVAHAVGVDPEPLIDEFDLTEAAPESAGVAELFQPVTAIKLKERHRPNWTAALAVALVAVIGVGVFTLRHLGAPSAVRPLAHASEAATAKHPLKVRPAAPHPSTRLAIRLTASQDCWVQLTGPGGQSLFSGTVYAGTTMNWVERHQAFLSLGNASGITLRVNGKNPVPPGSVGAVTLNLTAGHVPSY